MPTSRAQGRSAQAQPAGDDAGKGPLDGAQAADAQDRKAPSAALIHEAVMREGHEELARPLSGLAWSGLAAGLSMGFSLVAQGLLHAALPEAPWRPLIAKLGYSVGFLIVVLGRQELFTENTLTPVLPVLHERSWALLGRALRLWGVVLATNIVGAVLIGWVLARAQIFDPAVQDAFVALSEAAYRGAFGPAFVSAIFAGWLIALMVWLLPFAETSRTTIVILITYVVGLGHFAHCVPGSVEATVLVVEGRVSLGAAVGTFFIPTVLGNIVGGVLLVALLNHAQVVAEDG